MHHSARPLVLATLAAAVAACSDSSLTGTPNTPATELGAAPVTATVFATGLTNPRGLAFAPDGNLYVAEAGIGGTNSTVGQCKQQPEPFGPFTGGPSASIARVTPQGTVSTFATGLPSGKSAGGDVLGVSDVAFVGSTLYALIEGGGCSHGNPSQPNGIIRVNTDGSWSYIANLSAHYLTHPVARPEEEDFEPDGSPYSMTQYRGDFYVVESNHGSVERVTTSGSIDRIMDVSRQKGHIVPTSITDWNGDFYIGTLGTFPSVPGSLSILRVTPQGRIVRELPGVSAVVGVLTDRQGRLFVLEAFTCPTSEPCGPTPASGRVLMRTASGGWTPVVAGLMFPTAMAFGPDGNLYISTFGFGFPPGSGKVERAEVK
ncbi:MAG TPA: ScyD/ScyE family protein [Gemmatimonadaceae bacterium]|nr:ScyD/ScyE family protein [Gemmatimonadaceae bacterium]